MYQIVTNVKSSFVFADIEIRLPFAPIKCIDVISERVSERPGWVMGETLIMAANAAL